MNKRIESKRREQDMREDQEIQNENITEIKRAGGVVVVAS